MNVLKLQKNIPSDIFINLDMCISKFEINNVLRLSHFLSQCMHESNNFKVLTENLNYSSDGLKKVFGKYFPGNTSEQYARKPEKIASKVYANRMGNGSELSGDGYKFKGRGYIQLTGKNNYISFGKYINENVISNPDMICIPKYALMSAAWFWNTNGLNVMSDGGPTIDVVTKVTKKINGGTIGLDDRWSKFQIIYNLLSEDIGTTTILPTDVATNS